jgi:hypothetical protein
VIVTEDGRRISHRGPGSTFEVDHDVLLLEVGIDPGGTELTSLARLLEAAKWGFAGAGWESLIHTVPALTARETRIAWTA